MSDNHSAQHPNVYNSSFKIGYVAGYAARSYGAPPLFTTTIIGGPDGTTIPGTSNNDASTANPDFDADDTHVDNPNSTSYMDIDDDMTPTYNESNGDIVIQNPNADFSKGINTSTGTGAPATTDAPANSETQGHREARCIQEETHFERWDCGSLHRVAGPGPADNGHNSPQGESTIQQERKSSVRMLVD